MQATGISTDILDSNLLREPVSYVYFFEDTATGLVKIGKSINVKQRLYNVQLQIGTPIKFLGCVIGGLEKEAELHLRFAEHRVVGEWFQPVDTLVLLIRDEATKELPTANPVIVPQEPDVMEIIRDVARQVPVGADGDVVFDLCVNAGMQVSDDMDSKRWLLGGLAQLLGRRYGHDLIGQFAIGIGVRKRTVYEYEQVYSFFPEHARRACLEECPSLRFTHFRTAMRYGLKLHDSEPEALSTALEFLNEVIANDWTVDEADRERGVRTGGGSSLIGTYAATYHGAFEIVDSALKDGKRYTVKVYDGGAE